MLTYCILTLDSSGRGGDGRLDGSLFLGVHLRGCRRLFWLSWWRGLRLGRVGDGFRPDRDVLVVGEPDQSSVGLRGGGLQGLRGRQEDDERQQAQSVAGNHFGAAAVNQCMMWLKCVRLRDELSSVCSSVCLSVGRSVWCASCVWRNVLRPGRLVCMCVWCVHRPIRFDVVQCHGRGCVFIFISHGGGESIRPSCTRAVT